MNDNTGAALSDVARERLPWGVFVFLLAVFAVASFDPLLSVDYVTRRDKTVEERLEASIERTEAGNMARRVALSTLGGVALVSLLRRNRNRLSANGALGALILFFLAWTALSILWSHDQALTVRRVVLLGMLCLGALAAAERFSFREIVYFAFLAGGTALLGGLLCEIGLGTLRPFDPEYRFAGLMNPIFTGAHCGMTVIAALALARAAGRARGLYILVAVTAFLFMSLTRSRGPAGATVVAVLVYWALAWPKFRKTAVFMLALIAIVFAFPSVRTTITGSAEDALLFGRQVDRGYEMQGRDALWAECIKFSAQKPVLGYGYDAFWTRDFTFAVTDASGFTSQHTHNAVLDLLLGVGIPGAVTYLLILFVAIKRLVVGLRVSHSIYYASALALIVLYALHNVFVSVHLAAQLQTFVILVILARLGFTSAEAPAEQPDVMRRNREGPAHAHGAPESGRAGTGPDAAENGGLGLYP